MVLDRRVCRSISGRSSYVRGIRSSEFFFRRRIDIVPNTSVNFLTPLINRSRVDRNFLSWNSSSFAYNQRCKRRKIVVDTVECNMAHNLRQDSRGVLSKHELRKTQISRGLSVFRHPNKYLPRLNSACRLTCMRVESAHLACSI